MRRGWPGCPQTGVRGDGRRRGRARHLAFSARSALPGTPRGGRAGLPPIPRRTSRALGGTGANRRELADEASANGQHSPSPARTYLHRSLTRPPAGRHCPPLNRRAVSTTQPRSLPGLQLGAPTFLPIGLPERRGPSVPRHWLLWLLLPRDSTPPTGKGNQFPPAERWVQPPDGSGGKLRALRKGSGKVWLPELSRGSWC